MSPILVLPVWLFQVDSKLRGFIWHYAGAPVELTYEDTSNLDGLLNEQYIQFNLAESKHVGGIQTQGQSRSPLYRKLGPCRISFWTMGKTLPVS